MDFSSNDIDSGGIYFLPSACMLETARYDKKKYVFFYYRVRNSNVPKMEHWSLKTAGKQNVNISTMVGLKSQTSKEHLVRAVLESLAFQVQMLLDGIEKNYGKYTGIIK
ncbi:UNVERIFIED_CONTAM: hypothetical protein NCL1_15366 [Trichonephila clavipes]